jgi:hypothetical protein
MKVYIVVREENRLREFENKILGRMRGHRREDI